MKKGLLWQITTPESEQASYVFGTMHVRDGKAFQKLEEVYAAIQSCEVFAAEYNLNDSQSGLDPSTIQLREGQHISDLLHPKQYAKVKKMLWKAYQIPLDQFDRLLPFFVVNMIAQKILSEDMPLALDHHLWQYAQENGCQLTGVETFKEQIAILQAIPIPLQVRSLLKISGNVSAYRKQLLHLTTVYQTRDIQKIHKTAKRQLGGMRKLMLHQRNAIMAERISDLVAQNATFVAIGAAHLGGEKGVLRLLKQQGHKLSAIA